MTQAVRSTMAAMFLGATLAAAPARATDFPDRAVRIVVPYAPGGITDILARLLAGKLSKSWGQPVVVANIPGGGSVIGSETVAKASPDGYTVMLAAPDLAINPTLRRDLPYTLNDFAGVSMLARAPLVLVVPSSLRAKTVKELIRAAKSSAGKMSYASGGNGTTGHIATELFASMAGIELIHVPYKGVGAALPDLLSGRVSLMFAPLPVARPYIADRSLHPLAVASRKRSTAMPDLPTVSEAGLSGFELDPWFGVVAPAGTSETILFKFGAGIVEAMALADVVARLASLGAEPATSSPKEFTAFIQSEAQRLAPLVRKSRAKND